VNDLFMSLPLAGRAKGFIWSCRVRPDVPGAFLKCISMVEEPKANFFLSISAIFSFLKNTIENLWA